MAKVTHWMDDRQLVVTDKWLQSPEATSDYRAVYNVPCIKVRGKVVPIHPCTACNHSGRDGDGDRCDVCRGSGGLPRPN